MINKDFEDRVDDKADEVIMTTTKMHKIIELYVYMYLLNIMLYTLPYDH